MMRMVLYSVVVAWAVITTCSGHAVPEQAILGPLSVVQPHGNPAYPELKVNSEGHNQKAQQRSNYGDSYSAPQPRGSDPKENSSNFPQNDSTRCSCSYPSTDNSSYPSTISSSYPSTNSTSYPSNNSTSYPSTKSTSYPSTKSTSYPSTNSTSYPSTISSSYPSHNSSITNSSSYSSHNSSITKSYPPYRQG